jgi:hypothetical protein
MGPGRRRDENFFEGGVSEYCDCSCCPAETKQFYPQKALSSWRGPGSIVEGVRCLKWVEERSTISDSELVDKWVPAVAGMTIFF